MWAAIRDAKVAIAAARRALGVSCVVAAGSSAGAASTLGLLVAPDDAYVDDDWDYTTSGVPDAAIAVSGSARRPGGWRCYGLRGDAAGSPTPRK